MKFRMLSVAEGEAASAALWYETRQSGLSDEFLREMQVSLDSIRMVPQSMPLLENYQGGHELRRCRLRRFPWTIIFLCRPDELLVVAVAHTHRRPLYWLDRLNELP